MSSVPLSLSPALPPTGQAAGLFGMTFLGQTTSLLFPGVTGHIPFFGVLPYSDHHNHRDHQTWTFPFLLPAESLSTFPAFMLLDEKRFLGPFPLFDHLESLSFLSMCVLRFFGDVFYLFCREHHTQRDLFSSVSLFFFPPRNLFSPERPRCSFFPGRLHASLSPLGISWDLLTFLLSILWFFMNAQDPLSQG